MTTRRLLATALVLAALLAASGAWVGWLFQHTAGDASRSRQLAEAVLADPTARRELASDLAVSVAGAANDTLVKTFGPQVQVRINGHDPQVRQTVESVLTDPKAAESVTAAVAAAHANALGVIPAQPVVLDSSIATATARQYLATIDATLASQLPTIASIPFSIPAAEIPIATKVVDTSNELVPRLQFIAVVCLIGALVFGNRPRVVRSAGIWAVCAGALWMAAPTLVSWATDAWVPGHGAIVHALFRGVDSSVDAAATNLLVVGTIAIVVSILVSRALDRRAATPARTATGLGDHHDDPDAASRFGYAGRELPAPESGRGTVAPRR